MNIVPMSFLLRPRMLLTVLLAILVPSAISVLGAERLPKPKSESVKQAVKDIQEAYQQEYEQADQGIEQKQLLAEKLIEAAGNESDPIIQFTLLKEAINLQAAAQLAEVLVETTDTMSQRFELDGLKIKVHFLKKIAADTKKKNTKNRTVEAIRSVVDQAIATDQYDKALELLAAVAAMGERTRDQKLVREYDKLADTTRAEGILFRTVEEAQHILQDKPLDAEANQTVGEWYCLKRNRWEEGVTYLALGNHPEMKELGRLDLKIKKTVTDEIRLGDLCWELAEQMPGASNTLKKRAIFWYERAQPEVSGIVEKKIANRIESWEAEIRPPSKKGVESEKEEPRLAKRPKPLTKVKPKKWDAPKNLAGTLLSSRSGRVVIAPGQPPIQIPGKNNIYLHPYTHPGRSILVFDLDGRYRSFTGGVGVPDVPGYRGKPQSEITFSVIRDGKEKQIAKTARRGKRGFESFSLDVTSVKQLVLTTSCKGNFLGCFAFWFNPILSPEEVKPIEESRERR